MQSVEVYVYKGEELVKTGTNMSLDTKTNDGVDEMAEEKNKALRLAMTEVDIKVPQLAKLVGVHQSNLYAIVNGSLPHLRTAQRIVEELNKRGAKVTIDSLWPLPDEDKTEGKKT